MRIPARRPPILGREERQLLRGDGAPASLPPARGWGGSHHERRWVWVRRQDRWTGGGDNRRSVESEAPGFAEDFEVEPPEIRPVIEMGQVGQLMAEGGDQARLPEKIARLAGAESDPDVPFGIAAAVEPGIPAGFLDRLEDQTKTLPQDSGCSPQSLQDGFFGLSGVGHGA